MASPSGPRTPARRLPGWAPAFLAAVLWAGLTPWATSLAGEPVAPTTRPAQVQVQDGDMASVLAFRLKPRGATIEQMMVALLRHNPEAFIQGNVNLLRDGAVLRLPPAEEVLRTPPEEARDTVERHHKNFSGDLEKSVSQSNPPVAPGAHASAPEMDQAVEKAVLLERLRTAKARLSELQQNIQELEQLTRETPEPQPGGIASEPVRSSPDMPTSWIWLGVAAIVAVMVGVGSARRPDHKAVANNSTQTNAAAEFQARLGALDLSLDTAPSSPPPSAGQTR